MKPATPPGFDASTASRWCRAVLRDSARVQLHPVDVRSGRMVLQAWIASRGLIAAVALLLAVRQGGSLTKMVSNWDVNHFANLAQGGYYADPRGILMAFFPALPLILRAGLELGVPIAITGVVLSRLCSAQLPSGRGSGRDPIAGWRLP